ncbi:hypothetical protein [Roseivivax isoporae]|uniref:Uncharacterized protein n=1 Tax=Roseivivax isoporae LMG 25204 TaxID=1449351 RepID=X7F0Z7_9RHOB|nr:hypothetical protein [Roseivivax isoporae]ETX26547.1 hypothetical protein RISW2_22850 [Roseivivax isoporae LMG 25204]
MIAELREKNWRLERKVIDLEDSLAEAKFEIGMLRQDLIKQRQEVATIENWLKALSRADMFTMEAMSAAARGDTEMAKRYTEALYNNFRALNPEENGDEDG